eukprot:205047-Hanusia_phi.AAC.5
MTHWRCRPGGPDPGWAEADSEGPRPGPRRTRSDRYPAESTGTVYRSTLSLSRVPGVTVRPAGVHWAAQRP